MKRTLLEYIIIGVGAVAVIGGIMLALNFIPWLLWNKIVAPTFSWPQITFWKCFFLCWAISWLGRLLFGSRSTKS